MRYLAVILLFLSSCNYGLKEPTAPTNLIERDEMILILKDMTKLEAHIQQKYARVDKFYKTMSTSGEELLKEYKVSPKQFKSSMEYYAADQDEMRNMYNEALNLLNEELGEIQQQ